MPEGRQLVDFSAPSVIQQAVGKSTGSVASLAQAFASANTPGNTIIVVCGVGNGTLPTITDTLGNTYVLAANIANGTALNIAIYFAVNSKPGANTVTVNNGGTTASIAVEIYEYFGFLNVVAAQPDVVATATGTSATAATAILSPVAGMAVCFVGVGVGTAAQTITPAAGFVNDSGQQNPTTPAGLFSFIAMSQFVDDIDNITPQATFTSEPWAIVGAVFHAAVASISGSVKISDGTNIGAVKAASTAPVAADPAQVVTLSPNQVARTNIILYATAAAAGATTVETAITLTKSAGTGATSSAASFVVTSGKRFRITSITFASRGNATATIQTTTFSLRLNTGGAVTTTSTPVLIAVRSATPATASAWDRFQVPIPAGYEILGDGTLQIGVTANATFVTNAPTWDVCITGFEY